jgi:hypothetical protein
MSLRPSIIQFSSGNIISESLNLFRNQEFYGRIHRFLFLFSQFLMTGWNRGQSASCPETDLNGSSVLTGFCGCVILASGFLGSNGLSIEKKRLQWRGDIKSF